MSRFKQDPEFRVVIENLNCEHGRLYLEAALKQTPSLAEQLALFRQNDLIGTPITCHYGEHGEFAPTTLRYVKVLSDLLSLFGALDGLNIVEIGGGYGGQCFVTSIGVRPRSYTLVDIEPVLLLQQVYLERLAVPNLRFQAARELEPADYDLVISNYAFSECIRPVQRRYIDLVFSRSQRGYVACNWLRGKSISMTREELLAAVPGSHYESEVLFWGANSPSEAPAEGATIVSSGVEAREQPIDLQDRSGVRVDEGGLEAE